MPSAARRLSTGSFVARALALPGLIAALSLAGACSDRPEDDAESTASDVRATDFPAIFDPALWDIDPQIGNAIAGTAFTADGGRRQGILQLFVANTQNLDAFIAQQEAQVSKTNLKTVNGVSTLTRTAPQSTLTQTLRKQNGQTVQTGTVVFNGKTIVNFTQNTKTRQFDGQYSSPADRNTQHRLIIQPLKDGTFVGGSAYDLNDDGRALYTHIGLFDKALKPVKLLQFVQVDGKFADTAKDLAVLVGKVVDGKDIADPPVVAPPVVAPPVVAPPVVVAPPDNGNGNGNANNGAFPPLLDGRFFQLDLIGQSSPGNSGNIFIEVNAVAKNAVDDIQRLVDSSKVAIQKDVQGRDVEVRTAPGFESRQTFAKDVQEGVATIDGKKRFQFSRNFKTGAFEGVIIAPAFDASAPLVSIVTPKAAGTASHLIIEDIGNNLKNDYRGELLVDVKTLDPKQFIFFQQFQGGLAAQPESAALVKKFGFVGQIAGF